MRKRVITFLYVHKWLRWLLPIFHCLIGRNFVRGRDFNNKIESTTANLYHDKFWFRKGIENSVFIDDGTDLHYSKITFNGSHNKVIVGKYGFINGLDLIIEGDHNTVFIGDDVFILDDTRIYVVDGATFQMGKGCMFSDRIEIRTTDSHSIIDRATGKRINYEEDIILYDHVWVGTGVTILKGVKLANGCIVGAGSVVTRKHLTPNTIIVGNPAREVKDNVDWLMERI